MDIWGQALWDFHRGVKTKTLYLKTSYGPKEKVPLEEFFRYSDDFTALETYALELCQSPVVDLGAGTGAHALSLQKMGLEVTAIEQSPGACKVMKQRGVHSICCEDLYDHHPKRYNTALLLMNGLGLAGSKTNLNRFLARLKDYITPGGQIIMDSCDISYLYPETFEGVREELFYRYQYGGAISSSFSRLFANQKLLIESSEQVGLKAQIVFEEEYSYLARLTIVG